MKNINMKKIYSFLNIALVVMAVIMVIATFVAPSFALQPVDVPEENVDSAHVTTLGGRLISILRTVGVVLSVVVLIVIGIKYMMGSPEEKSEYKSSLLPYVIGAGLIFAASIFAQTIYEFFSGLGK